MATLTVLPLDIERELPSNVRTNEIHDVIVAKGKVNRVIVPDFGAFFTEGFELRDSTGKALDRHKDFELTYHYELFSELSGQGVCALVVITNPQATSPFSITYHAVGGNFSLSVKELADVIAYIDSDTQKKIKWDDIIDKPTAYVPAEHFNEYWQLIGLDTTVDELNRLVESIRLGRDGILGDNTDFWQSYVEQAKQKLDEYIAAVMRHVTDKSNPHNTTKAQVGLSQINNWSFATVVESADPTIKNKYQPIGGIYNQIDARVSPLLDAHRTDVATLTKPDPHNVTLAQLKAYSAVQIDQLFNQRLAKTAIAYDTAMLAGVNYQQMYNNVRSNLDTSNVIQGYFQPYDPTKVFQQYQLAPVPNVGEDIVWYILCGDQQYRHIRDMIAGWNSTRTGVVYLGNDGSRYSEQGAMNAINAYNPPGGISVGTQAVACWSPVIFWRQRQQQLVVCKWNGAGWERQL